MDFKWENLEETLKSLGVKAVFDVENANLNNISDEALYVSKVVHKAVIKVNEEGSEAVAASGVVLSERWGPNSPHNFWDKTVCVLIDSTYRAYSRISRVFLDKLLSKKYRWGIELRSKIQLIL